MSRRPMRIVLVIVVLSVLGVLIAVLGSITGGDDIGSGLVKLILLDQTRRAAAFLVTILGTAMIGLVLGGIPALCVAAALGHGKWSRDLLRFSLGPLRLLPVVSLMPLFWIWFREGASIAVVAVGVFAIFTVWCTGTTGTTLPLPKAARASSRVSPFRAYRVVVVPAVLCRAIAGLRLVLATALGLALVGSTFTVGGVLRQGFFPFTADWVIVMGRLLVIVMFVGVSILLDRLTKGVTESAARKISHRIEQSLLRMGLLELPGIDVVTGSGSELPVSRPVRHTERRDGSHSSFGTIVRAFLLPVAALLVWFLVTEVGILNPPYYPSPLGVFQVLTGGYGYGGTVTPLIEILPRPTLTSLLLVLVSTLLGLLGALALTYIRWARDLPPVSANVVRSIPLYAAIPVILMLLDSNGSAVVAAGSLGVFLVLTIKTSDSMCHIPHFNVVIGSHTRELRYRSFRTEVMPAILPDVIAGLRLAVAAGWALSIATDLMFWTLQWSEAPRIAIETLVLVMLSRGSILDTGGMLVVVLLYAAMAILSDYGLRAVAKRCGLIDPPLGLVV